MTERESDDRRSDVLQLYQLAVEMADRVSARRGTANAFFLTAETAFVAVESFALAQLSRPPAAVILVLSITGIGLSAAWWLQLRAYRILNSAKFAVILDIEANLPVALFSDEWRALQERGRQSRYAELGLLERSIPMLFAVLYAVLGVSTTVH